MKKVILILALCISFTGFSQKVKDSILSRKMDKYRDLTISVPSSYDKNSKKTYPLLLLLDGSNSRKCFRVLFNSIFEVGTITPPF